MTHSFHSPSYSSGRTPVGKTILRAAACLVWVGGVVLAIATSVCTETVGTVSRTAFSWLNFHTALCAYALYGGLLWIAGALFDRPGTFRRALSSLRDLFPGRRDATHDFDPDYEVPPHFGGDASNGHGVPYFGGDKPEDFDEFNPDDVPDDMPEEFKPHRFDGEAPKFKAPHFGGDKPEDFDEFNPDDVPDDMPEEFKPHRFDGKAPKFKTPHFGGTTPKGFEASHFDGSDPEDFEAPRFDGNASEDFKAYGFDGGDSADSSIPGHEEPPFGTSEADEDEERAPLFVGSWPQESGEPIVWDVLAKEGNRKLLLSRKAVAKRPYHDADEPVSWETCSLRAWLNGDFYRAAFNDYEKQHILKIPVTADRNTYCNTDAGNSTDDHVFLLSLPEVNALLRRKLSAKRKCEASPADAPDADNDNKAADDTGCVWWLRSPGSEKNEAACVNGDGQISNFGLPATTPTIAVRPCIWVRDM